MTAMTAVVVQDGIRIKFIDAPEVNAVTAAIRTVAEDDIKSETVTEGHI